MKKTRIISLFLATVMLSSCGGTASGSDETTTAPVTEETTVPEESGYDYPDVDYGGYEFRVLNFDQYVNCNLRVDITEQSGERLSDAIYTRNRFVEDKLNFKMCEITHPYTSWAASQKELGDLIVKSVMAGDDAYDAAYPNLSFNVGVITDNCLVDLKAVKTLNLDEEWWDHAVNDSIEIGGKLFAASSPLHLESSDLAWVILFNQEMMDDLKLDYPYQTVRDGNWTIDKFYEYASQAANLNGDESFSKWNASGNSTYGIAGHFDSALAFTHAAGNRHMKLDGESYELTFTTERFFNTIEKLSKLNQSGTGIVRYNNGGKGNVDGYIEMFASNRALFITGELKTVIELRHMEATFGLLPMPKYDETQENYETLINGGSALLCIPKTNKDLDRTGVILDALSYESNVSVIPEYYDVTVSQKGLRNEESIEMLKIVRETRSVEIGSFLALTTTIASNLQTIITAGNTEFASSVEKHKNSVLEKIQKTIDAVK